MAELDEEGREGIWGEVYDKTDDKPGAKDFDITSLFNPRHLSDAIDRVEGLRRGGIALGALVIVALIFLCFKLAFNTATRVADARGLSHRADPLPDDDVDRGVNPGMPGRGAQGRTYGAAAGGYLPPMSGGPVGPPPPPPLPAPGAAGLINEQIPIFADEDERLRVAQQLSQARDAYDMARKLDSGPFWQKPRPTTNGTTPGSVTPVSARAGQTSAFGGAPGAGGGAGAGASSTPLGTAPMPGNSGITLGAGGQEAAETHNQVEALSTEVTLSMHPDRYPSLLQRDAKAFALEMRTYLSTVDYGLTSPDEQGRLHGTASPHLTRAGEILSRLEQRLKSGTMPLDEAMSIAGPNVGLPSESQGREGDGNRL